MNLTSCPTASLREKCKLLESMISPQRLARFNQVLETRTQHITLVMDQIVKEHNFAAITRTADAFGIGWVHYVGSQVSINTGISMGTDRWVEIVTHLSPASAIEHLRGRGYQIVTLCAPTSESGLHRLSTSSKCLQPAQEQKDNIPRSLLDVPFTKPTALVFGNEKNGVSPEFSENADLQAYIPMCGFVESLNVSVAAGVCMFAARQLAPTCQGHLPADMELSEEQKLALKLSWLMRDVTGAELILKHHYETGRDGATA